MKKLLLIALLFVSADAFCQIPYKTKEEPNAKSSKEIISHDKNIYMRKAGNLGIVSQSLIIGSGTVMFLAANHTIKKKNVNDDSLYVIAGAMSFTSVILQMCAWNCIIKAGKTTNTIGLNVSPAGASVAVTF